MKAAVYDRYGPPDVLYITETAKPVPRDDEVLIRTYSATVTTGDWRARSLEMPAGFGFFGRLAFGIRAPRQPILGTELSGEVEAVGKNVKKFRIGDEVLAFGGAGMGCHSEYRCIREEGPIALKPPNLTHDEAAAVTFGGTTALDFFKRAKLRKGERVLINGASGGVGTAAVQLARHFGADVTGVCSATNAEMVRSIGARQVIDYTSQDFSTNGEKYDVIVDTVGNAPYSRSKTSLTDDGRLLVVLGSLADLLRAPLVGLTSSRKVIAGPVKVRPEDVRFLAGLAESGEFTPVIDRRFPLEQIAEAHRYVDSGRKKGNVIVNVVHVN